MHEATVYQNLTQLSIRKSRADFLLSELTQLLEICHVEITSLHLERQHCRLCRYHTHGRPARP